MKIQDFFRIFFGSDFPGFISIWDKQTKHSKFFRNCELDSMSRYIKKKYKNNDLYFGCGLRADKEMPGRGKHENIIGIPGFWMDLDLKADVHKSDNYPVDKIEAYKILHEFPLAPTIVNSSGYGLHLFWLFEKPWIFRDEKERNEAHVLSGKFQDKIISLFKNHGYILDKTADLPRILRIPSTLNHKKDSAVPVKIVRIKDEMNRRYTLDAIRNAINNKSKLKSRVAKPIKNAFATGTFPNSNVENILQRCQWFHHCQMDSRSLSEPEWFAMLTIITFCENPLSWAYDLSKNYDGFSQEETYEKVARIRKTWTRPVSCKHIKKNFGDYCKNCTQNVKSPYEIGIDKSQSALESVGFGFNEEGKVKWLNGNIFARYILNRMKLVYTDSGLFHEYYDGVWHSLDHNCLSRKLRKLLHEFVPDFWTERLENIYMAVLKREAPYIKRLNPYRHYLNLKNGILNLKTFDFRPQHNPKLYSSVQLSIDYDEDAVCPKFDDFLLSIFEGDKQLIKVVYEIMGYCLTSDTNAQEAFFFYGQGSNGKSLLADIILNLCGPQNASAIPLEDLQNPFNRYELVDKLVNISTENEFSSAGLNTAHFKAIVSGDPIQVERKFEQSFTYRPFCKLIFSLNTLPYSRDKSWSFQRRLIVIPFNRTFRQTDADYKNYTKLRTDLLNELPGILNRSLQALKRLRKNRYVFSYSEAIEKLQTEYKHVLNPYSQFVAEMIEQGNTTDKISNDTMHRVFEEWCFANGHKKLASGSHLKRLIEIKNALKDAKIDFGSGKGHKSGGKRHIGYIQWKTKNRLEVDDIAEMED